MEVIHQPVLVEQVVAALAPVDGGVYVDCTVGLGGHARALLERAPGARVIGFDVDPAALAVAGRNLERSADRVTLVHAPYGRLTEQLAELGVDAVDGVLFDLGVSSLQLDDPARGFSFRFDAPLDMRFSGDGATAAELIAAADEEELVRILFEFGEEPRARRVARALVRARDVAPIGTTSALHRVVIAALGRQYGRIDPATRTFQALRIATNRELESIPGALAHAARALKPAGRLAVIAFHSLEDRIAKRTLRHLSGRCVCPPGMFACLCKPEDLLEVLTPRPIRPGAHETAANPRARSARLRVAARRGV